jgi:glycosyltransferase involved in cell wall biosynthesis
MQNPLVSIITPVKDTAPYLPTCIQGIIDQSYKNWELIAVNDHSSDNSVDLLNEFARRDSRVKVFHASEPKLLPALRLGFEKSSGDLIQRLDSDDALPKNKLQQMVNAWLNVGEGHIVSGKVKYFREDGPLGEGYLKYENWMNEVIETNTHWQQIYKESGIATGAWLVHRSDFIKAGAFDANRFPEDYDLAFRFYSIGLKVEPLNKVVHLWRDRSDRITRQWDEYADNRFFQLKTHHFFEIDRIQTRPLVLWGGGKTGKDLAKQILNFTSDFNWLCDNDRKVGKDIYGIKMQHFNELPDIENPQILIAVSSPDGKKEIQNQLLEWGKEPVKDYWFFS